MVVINHFQDIIASLDKAKGLSLPKCKENLLKMEFSNSNDEETVYNGDAPPLPFAVSEVFHAPVIKGRRLTAEDNKCKAVYEITFDIENSNFDFKPGDTIGCIPRNSLSEVGELINHLGLNDVADLNYTLNTDCGQKGTKLPLHVPIKSTLRHVLTNCVDLRGVLKKLFLLALSQHTKDDSEKQILEYLCSKEGSIEYTTHILNKNITLLDLFSLFKTCKPPIGIILEHLPRLLPRPYSIVNSKCKNSNILKICFSVIDTCNNKKGITTGWLEQIILKNCNIEDKMSNLSLHNECIKVPIYLRKNMNEFCLPNNTDIPLILIGPGTGVSPFISFLEEREHLRNIDANNSFGFLWMFFGCRNPKLDYIFENELNYFKSQGVINKLSTAFSRIEHAEYNYVQDAIRKNGEQFAKLVLQGAHIYVCGDIKVMAAQVKDTIIQCITEYGNKNKDEAEKFVANMQKEKRYINDIWN